jgi:hypothetical protein
MVQLTISGIILALDLVREDLIRLPCVLALPDVTG